ncbi:MAG: hypothetical protein SO434_06170, partial [Eubacteriales bacterium]|nr:hypothetical protein [Eubacteriales bacterium]
LFDSELNAKLAEEVLGNEDFINRIVKDKPNLAKRIVETIQNIIKVFKMNKVERRQYSQLLTAERLYLKAAYNTPERQALAKMIEQGIEENKQIKVEVGVDQTLALQYNKKQYNKKTQYVQWKSDALAWANSDRTKIGDMDSGSDSRYTYFYRAIDPNNDGRATDYKVVKKVPLTNDELINKWCLEVKENNERNHASVYESIDEYESTRKKYQGNNGIAMEQRSRNGRIDTIYKGESESDGIGHSKQGNRNKRAVDYHFNDDGSQIVTYSDGTKKKSYSLKLTDYNNVLDNLNAFNSIDELKAYFDSVLDKVNEDANGLYTDELANIVEIENQAIKKYRKKQNIENKKQIDDIDKKYNEALEKKDYETAKYLVEQMAILKGYAVTDYRMDHRAPSKDGYCSSLDDVTSKFGEDIYGKNAVKYFGTYEGFDYESIRHIQESKGKPNAYITVYRAVPKSIKGDQINNGDWITLTRQYAENHGKNNIIGNYRIISKRVKIGDIYTNGDSIHEFGYDDGKDYYYRNTENYKKLANVITYDYNGNPIRLKDRFNYKDSDIRYSKKITRDMSDLERYNVLKDRVIENVPTAKELPSDVAKEIGKLRSSEKRALVKKILEEFGVFDRQYENADIELTFNFSRNNFQETYSKQKRRYVRFTKMFSVFDRIIENAVGIEVHNRNDIDYKYDPTLQTVYVLVSAFNDGDEIVPVKLEVKEFTDKKNSLYVAIALESIKKEGVSEQGSTNGVAQDSRPSTISISDLFRKINPNEKDFTKYIPPQFFESNIQYSRKSPAPSQVGDIIKAKGNLTTDKIFTKDEAKKIIAEIEERLVFEEKGKIGTVKGTNELIDRLWKGLNKADKGEYTRVGVEIADYVIKNSVVEDMYECLYGDVEVDEAREVIKTLKQYFHKVKISDRVLGEIKHHFDDKASKVLSLWRAKEGGLA